MIIKISLNLYLIMSKNEQKIIGPASPFKAFFIERVLQIRAFYLHIKNYMNSFDQKIQEKYDEEAMDLARNEGIEDILISDFKPFFMSLLFIQIHTTLEIYFNDILEFIFRNKIDILKNSNKQYSTEEILSFNDMDDLVKYLAIKEIKSFNDKNSIKKIEYLKKLLNKEHILTELLISNFIEFCEIRHILVHNEGNINDRFRKLVNNPKYDNEISIVIDDGSLLEAIDFMISFINAIDNELCSKFRMNVFGFVK